MGTVAEPASQRLPFLPKFLTAKLDPLQPPDTSSLAA